MKCLNLPENFLTLTVHLLATHEYMGICAYGSKHSYIYECIYYLYMMYAYIQARKSIN